MLMTVDQITEGFQCVNTWAVTHCRPYISWHLHLQVGSDCWRLKFHAKHLHIVSSSSFLALLLKHYKNDSVSNFKHRVVFTMFYIHITRKYLVLPRDSTGVGWPRGWIFKITEPCMKAFGNNIFLIQWNFFCDTQTNGWTDRQAAGWNSYRLFFFLQTFSQSEITGVKTKMILHSEKLQSWMVAE